MSKKILGVLLATAMVASTLVGCGNAAPAAEAPAAEAPAADAAAPADDAAPADVAAVAAGTKVGVSMPTKDLQRWNQDGANMQSELEAAGYEVDLQYASNDVQTQVSQVENMIASGANVLVIAAIEGSSLGEALDMAKEAGIPVIAYDRLIMNSDAVSYYATFDNYMVGTKQGE
ncbi:MAG: substrate-binding domain-containing protein, partial [Lachnospiraceae bacterium]|nr:substrate-binding domain-containing protein [Candidatus Colinaster scatohippi]